MEKNCEAGKEEKALRQSNTEGNTSSGSKASTNDSNIKRPRGRPRKEKKAENAGDLREFLANIEESKANMLRKPKKRSGGTYGWTIPLREIDDANVTFTKSIIVDAIECELMQTTRENSEKFTMISDDNDFHHENVIESLKEAEDRSGDEEEEEEAAIDAQQEPRNESECEEGEIRDVEKEGDIQQAAYDEPAEMQELRRQCRKDLETMEVKENKIHMKTRIEEAKDQLRAEWREETYKAIKIGEKNKERGEAESAEASTSRTTRERRHKSSTREEKRICEDCATLKEA
ncbi:hypothetical protein PV327_007345 [Microctonus hyperodae]|uniref:Uncharacterized protein n=1 Tax=Microctonus hyperodae TaxID=165561 RepID=A0AA39FZ06_MICHY|nr:hypothetical protein PV327_007345 [Microctonus hyperodae]